MNGIIDIHNHILYGVDDGARDFQESIMLIKESYKQGVRQMILTPHYPYSDNETNSTVVAEHFNRLKEEIDKIFPDMKLYLGQEILVDEDTIENIKNNNIYTLAGSSYVLIEFYTQTSYQVILKCANDLILAGYRPIIAHCERYKCLRTRFGSPDRDKISHLVEMGTYLQMNVSTVYKDKTFAKKLINMDALHFIASDAHNMHNRTVDYEKCIQYLEKKYNSEYLKWLFVENPGKVINDKYI